MNSTIIKETTFILNIFKSFFFFVIATFSSDLIDIIAPLEIFSASSWTNPENPYHNMRSESLKEMKKVAGKNRESATEETKRETVRAVGLFSINLPKVLIRRHESSRWFSEHLIELKPLHRFRVTAAFPLRYDDNYESMIAIWKSPNLQKLRPAQDIWDQNIHFSTYRQKHPTRSKTSEHAKA